MTFQTHSAPFEDDLLLQLATDLEAQLPEAKNGDFSAGWVILPSSRACRTLGHVLLENQTADTLLLPRILTPGQLEEELCLALDLPATGLPNDLTRPLILAHALKKESWLRDRPESAPGLAAEYISLFDEIRLHGQRDQLLSAEGLQSLTGLVNSETVDQQEDELKQIRRVWELYREKIPRDSVDLLVDIAGMMEEPDNLPPEISKAFSPDLFLVAGFANLNPMRGAWMRALAGWAAESRLYLPEARGPLARFFADTWSPAAEALDPLAAARKVGGLLVPCDGESEPKPPARTLRQRVSDLGDPEIFWAPKGPLELLACGRSEDESRVVADRVVRLLAATDGARKRTAVVTNDPVLAARIVVHLRDAGVDTDQTLGAPLSSLPAGLLLRFILRTVLTDFRTESLLEVITHPYVSPPAPDQKVEQWNLRLETMLRRYQGGQPGRLGLEKLALGWDESAQKFSSGNQPGMTVFVNGLLEAFAPLSRLAGDLFATWNDMLPALVKVWNNLCPDEPLEENKEKSDIKEAARLLDDLKVDARLLPAVGLAGFSADLGRMLTAKSVAPHRGKAKPVVVAGTVEARLEKFDHLFLAGMAEGNFPARSRRPLFLNSNLRRRLQLPDWRESLARDAALFLRLLFNAPQVLVTWPTEGDGRPILPSPFVARLALALPDGREPDRASAVPLWRRSDEDIPATEQLQAQFKAEGLVPVCTQKIRPLNQLSWSALRTWRECPYRYLLARGFQMQKEDEVRQEFGRRDFGSLVHQSLCAFLQPSDEGYAALLAGQEERAAEILAECARHEFLGQGEDTAVRRLWLDNFCECIPEIVTCEVKRFVNWRPVLLECEFQLSVAELLGWLRQGGFEVKVPENEPGDESTVLRGTIDRVDELVSASGGATRLAAIVDYKTGSLPSPKKVTDLEDLQIILYALALEAGAVDGSAPAERRVEEGFYYGISPAAAGPPAKLHLPEQDRSLLAAGGLELVRLARLAADPEQDFSLIPAELDGEGGSALPCRYCDFRGVCRLEERPGLPAPTALKLDHLVNRKEGAW